MRFVPAALRTASETRNSVRSRLMGEARNSARSRSIDEAQNSVRSRSLDEATNQPRLLSKFENRKREMRFDEKDSGENRPFADKWAGCRGQNTRANNTA